MKTHNAWKSRGYKYRVLFTRENPYVRRASKLYRSMEDVKADPLLKYYKYKKVNEYES